MNKEKVNLSSSINRKDIFNITLVLIFSLLSQLHIILKYGGRHWDGDGLVMSHYTSLVLNSGSITETGYVSGINYQIMVTFLSQLCHINLNSMYAYAIPILNSLLIVVAYLIMANLTKNKHIALLATFLLLLQPDFLIITNRAKHDFYSYLLALLFYVQFFKYHQTTSFNKKSTYFLILSIILFSLSMYSLPFFSMFVLSLIIYLVLDYHIYGYTAKTRSLVHFFVVSLILIFVLNPNIYSPYQSFFISFGKLYNSLSMLFFETFSSSEDVYSGFITSAYNSNLEFLFLYMFNILLFIITVYSLYNYPREIKSETKLVFISFCILTLLMLISDRYGFAGNMGLRAFYYVTYPAVAISSTCIVNLITSHKVTTKKFLVIIFVISLLFYTSNVKSTGDSNWINIPFHYTAAEENLLEFLQDSDIRPVFADHRLTYVGAICMSTDFWSRSLFINDYSNYINSSKKGFYLYSDIYNTRGYRSKEGLILINQPAITELELKNKIYTADYTSIYYHD